MLVKSFKIHYCIIAKWIFEAICIICTTIFIVNGINKYLEDSDVTIIETQTYKDNGVDFMPAISMCFPQDFEDDKFKKLEWDVFQKLQFD